MASKAPSLYTFCPNYGTISTKKSVFKPSHVSVDLFEGWVIVSNDFFAEKSQSLTFLVRVAQNKTRSGQSVHDLYKDFFHQLVLRSCNFCRSVFFQMGKPIKIAGRLRTFCALVPFFVSHHMGSITEFFGIFLCLN